MRSIGELRLLDFGCENHCNKIGELLYAEPQEVMCLSGIGNPIENRALGKFDWHTHICLTSSPSFTGGDSLLH